MRALLKLATFGSIALLLACSERQADRSNDNRDDSLSARISTPTIELTGRVTDAAGILAPEQEATLSAKLELLERVTGHQVVVATVSTLGGADIATFTQDLANSWGIGRKDYDDGVVILVAPNEQQVRVAVGYGLERSLTNGVCKEIIDKHMLPRFRKGDLPGGIEAGTDAVVDRLRPA